MRTNTDLPRIMITTGDPAGIGPDITVQIAQENIHADIVAIGDPDLLRDRASFLRLPLSLIEFDDSCKQKHIAKSLRIIPVKIEVPAQSSLERAAGVANFHSPRIESVVPLMASGVRSHWLTQCNS